MKDLEEVHRRMVEITKEIKQHTKKTETLSNHIDKCTKHSDKIKLGIMIIAKSALITALGEELLELSEEFRPKAIIHESESVFTKEFMESINSIHTNLHTETRPYCNVYMNGGKRCCSQCDWCKPK